MFVVPCGTDWQQCSFVQILQSKAVGSFRGGLQLLKPPTESCALRNLEMGHGTTLGLKLHSECLEKAVEQSPPCGVTQRKCAKLIFELFIYLI